MTDKKKATDVGEEELDKVRGGGNTVPVESLSLNYEKIKLADDGAKSITDGTSNTFLVGERNR